jgi:hypothetical protein
MCRCRTSLIGGTKKGHGKISWPNPIEVLQQNPPESCRGCRQPAWQLRATSGLVHCSTEVLLDHFVSDSDQRGGNGKPERFCGGEIDTELETGRLLGCHLHRPFYNGRIE